MDRGRPRAGGPTITRTVLPGTITSSTPGSNVSHLPTPRVLRKTRVPSPPLPCASDPIGAHSCEPSRAAAGVPSTEVTAARSRRSRPAPRARRLHVCSPVVPARQTADSSRRRARRRGPSATGDPPPRAPRRPVGRCAHRWNVARSSARLTHSRMDPIVVAHAPRLRRAPLSLRRPVASRSMSFEPPAPAGFETAHRPPVRAKPRPEAPQSA
jgi:hypothetical protein